MNKQEITRCLQEACTDDFTNGALIKKLAFLAWPYWSLDIEIEFALKFEPGILDRRLFGMKEAGLDLQQIQFVTGFDENTVKETLSADSDLIVKRSGTFLIDDMPYDALFGTFPLNEDREFRKLNGIRQRGIPLITCFPLVSPPQISEISPEILSQVVDSRDELKALIGQGSLVLKGMTSITKDLRFPAQYSLVVLVWLALSGRIARRAVDLIGETQISLDDAQFETIDKHFLSSYQPRQHCSTLKPKPDNHRKQSERKTTVNDVPGPPDSVRKEEDRDNNGSGPDSCAQANELSAADHPAPTSHNHPIRGDVLKGTILAHIEDIVIVDVGLDREGCMDDDEFNGSEEIKINAQIDVLYEGPDSDGEMLRLSKRKADAQKNWRRVMQDRKKGDRVTGRVYKNVKGGLMVDVGVPAFLPGSQVSKERDVSFDTFVGQELTCVIIELNDETRNVVISQRKAQDQQQA